MVTASARIRLDISIHVLRVEDDQRLRSRPVSATFQSTSSMWRTTFRKTHTFLPRKFQSTSSMWRTTFLFRHGSIRIEISIHVLHVEDDV